MKNKKDLIYLFMIILLAGLATQFYFSYRYQPQHQISVYYSQEKELNKQIISLIRDADKYVYFAIYTFTRYDIKDALLAAKYRGLDVVGVTDRKQTQDLEQQSKIIKELREAGIPIYEQDHTGIMHLKTLVTEKGYASGSFNWTSAATNINDEVLEVGKDDKMRNQYYDILEKLINRYKNDPLFK